MVIAGSTLRQMREKLGLTMRDVETASERLAPSAATSVTLFPSADFQMLKPKE